MITICIQCHNFQRRLCWMLSSLMAQTCQDYKVDIAYLKNNGTPKTKDLLAFFNDQGMKIGGCEYFKIEKFERRGIIRNKQLQECQTDWVWFCDSDHVYHPEYVERLLIELETRQDETKVVTAGRMSTVAEDTNKLVDSVIQDKPCYFKDAFKRANCLEPKARRRACGAGHTQIARVNGPHEGIYVEEYLCKDWRWTKGFQKAKSDIQFRRRCGGAVKLPRWFTLNQIHLNHLRDRETGQHLNVQR